MRFPRGGLPGLLATLGVLVAGCGARFSHERRPDGVDRLRCRVSLPDCLVEVEQLCQYRRYIVLRAVDNHDRPAGGANLGVRTSEVLFRCGPAISWPIGFDPMASPPIASPPMASPPPMATTPDACAPPAAPAGDGGAP
jgi:hypothetical protein